MTSQSLRKKAERAEYILKRLTELYPNPPIPLDHSDAYTLLIAVLLSAQCTDKRVNLITPHLFARAKTPQDMVKVPVEEIRDIIRPCGLSPQKSKAISGLSKILIEKFSGQVPNNLDDLESLPGVGHKTAQVVMAQVFGIPSFPVDTHIHRLAKRWKLSNGKSVLQTERDLKSLFPMETWNKLHLQIIFYGREFCTARGCQGQKCEICSTLNGQKLPANENSFQNEFGLISKHGALRKKSKAKSAPSQAKLKKSSKVKSLNSKLKSTRT